MNRMVKRKTFLQKRKAKKSMKKSRSARKTLKSKTRKMTGGNYSVATYDGFKNKGNTRMFFPGGSFTWEEYKKYADSKLDI